MIKREGIGKSKSRAKGVIALFATVFVVAILLVGAVYMLKGTTQDLSENIYPEEYKQYVEKYSKEYNLDEALVYAVIKTESNFDEDAVSGVGAMGLMQIMPGTFEWLQTLTKGEITMDSDSLLDPEININYGCEFLRFLLNRYSVESTAVAAYNAGFGAVDGWLADENYSKDGENLDYIPYPETSNYVVKVENAKEYYNSN